MKTKTGREEIVLWTWVDVGGARACGRRMRRCLLLQG